jgi:hypothetical protein
MRDERLTIRVTRREMRELTALAKKRNISVRELVRAAVAGATRDSTKSESLTLNADPEQVETLERAAEATLRSLQRAAAALDRAEAELARTRAHFNALPREV